MTEFELQIQEDLHKYLQAQGCVEPVLPDAPDIEQMWEPIAQAYLPDGMREFNGYPVVSLGWMMYVGMAVALMWDEDWEHYSALDNIYLHLRDQRGYDAMDEYIREEVLHLSGAAYADIEKLTSECASRTYSKLLHSGIEAGTPEAFHAYVACLHQLYLMGAAVQLASMGYRMTRVQ